MPLREAHGQKVLRRHAAGGAGGAADEDRNGGHIGGAAGSVATKLFLQMGFPERPLVYWSEGMTARSAVQPGLYAFRKT